MQKIKKWLKSKNLSLADIMLIIWVIALCIWLLTFNLWAWDISKALH